MRTYFIWVHFDKYNSITRKKKCIDHVNSHFFWLKTEERSLGTWKNGRSPLIKSAVNVKNKLLNRPFIFFPNAKESILQEKTKWYYYLHCLEKRQMFLSQGQQLGTLKIPTQPCWSALLCDHEPSSPPMWMYNEVKLFQYWAIHKWLTLPTHLFYECLSVLIRE